MNRLKSEPGQIIKCFIFSFLVLGLISPSLSHAEEPSNGESTVYEFFNRIFFGVDNRADKLNSPKRVIDRAISLAIKNNKTDFDKLVYVRPYAGRQFVKEDSDSLFADITDMLNRTQQDLRYEITGPKQKTFTMLNRDTWTEKEETYTVMLYGKDDLPVGIIPVTCYTLRNCIEQLVTNFCGVEFGRN
jgi:hypothetical protein